MNFCVNAGVLVLYSGEDPAAAHATLYDTPARVSHETTSPTRCVATAPPGVATTRRSAQPHGVRSAAELPASETIVTLLIWLRWPEGM